MTAMLRLIPIIILLSSCGGDLPTAPPTPEPSPPPSPPPFEFPQVIFPVRANGTQFIDGTGRAFWRWGASDLYGAGWTLPKFNTLEKLSRAGVNWVGARPGPQSIDGPDGMYAPPNLWSALDETLTYSNQLGQVLQIAIFDLWVIQHGHSYFPEWDFADFHGRSLTSSQLAWVSQLLERIKGWRHVVLLDGNEMFKAQPSIEWFRALKGEVRRRMPNVLLCTNAENRNIEREADCVLIHQDAAVANRAGRPTGVDESGPNLTCLAWAKESQYARRLATFIDLWRGEMEDAEWNACLATHAEMRRASGR